MHSQIQNYVDGTSYHEGAASTGFRFAPDFNRNDPITKWNSILSNTLLLDRNDISQEGTAHITTTCHTGQVNRIIRATENYKTRSGIQIGLSDVTMKCTS
jgi:hypothetical protein